MEQDLNSKDKILFVGGINGVGKTTFLKELNKTHPEFQIVRGSAMFMEWLGIKPGDYDSLRALPDDYKDLEFDKMMRDTIESRGSSGNILLFDAHYLNFKRGETTDVTGEWISLMDALFLVTAEPDEVLTRIVDDQVKTGRDRALFPESASTEQQQETISMYLEKTLDKVKSLSEKHDIPYFVINNERDNINGTVETFVQLVSGLKNN